MSGLPGDVAYSFKSSRGRRRRHVGLGFHSLHDQLNISGTLDAGDDNYSDAIDLGMSLNFYGLAFSQVYVNQNGNLTISNGMGKYSPIETLTTGYGAMIAPFFTDVDTRDGYGSVYYGPANVDGHEAWTAVWGNVRTTMFSRQRENTKGKSTGPPRCSA